MGKELKNELIELDYTDNMISPADLMERVKWHQHQMKAKNKPKVNVKKRKAKNKIALNSRRKNRN